MDQDPDPYGPDGDRYCGTGGGIAIALVAAVVLFWAPIVALILYVAKG